MTATHLAVPIEDVSRSAAPDREARRRTRARVETVPARDGAWTVLWVGLLVIGLLVVGFIAHVFVISRVTQGSASAKSGSWVTTLSSQPTTPSPTRPAMTVVASGFDSEASAKTVSGSTGAASPARRRPKPFR